MSHFAKVEEGLVTQVIVAEQDFIDAGHVGDPANWVQTSYNTRAGLHYGTNEDGNYVPDGGVAFRGNYAGIGFIYDAELDAFYPPSPFPSWTLSTTTYSWQAPTPMPELEGKFYTWNEDKLLWDEHDILPPA
jgi:hypothetical protein